MSPDALQDPIREHVAGLGYELVDLRRAGTLDRPILQLRVDRPDSRPGHGVTAEDCAAISRSLERFLESRALVGPRYVLEVSSPGIERPLRQPDQWRRFVGRKARVRTRGEIGSPPTRRSFTGELLGATDDAITVAADGGVVSIPYADITRSNLVGD